MKDLDYFVETQTFEQLSAKMDVTQLHQSSFGFHLSIDSGKWLSFLNSNLRSGQKFPLQIMSGPALTLRYHSALPELLVSMVKEEKVVLCAHLPFVVTIYKEAASLEYQWLALKELSEYYKSLGILEKVFILFHCSHPSFEPSGNVVVQWNFWRGEALKNLKRFQALFPNLLIENLVGYKGQPLDVSSPNGLWVNLIKGTEFENTLGFALDTEHLFGAGQTLTGILPDVLSRIKFVHFNAAPSNAKFGWFTDLHSYTSIRTSLIRKEGPFSVEGSSLIDYKTLGLLSVPAVFERKHMSTQIDDLDLCVRYLL